VIVLPFAHPLTDEQLEQIEAETAPEGQLITVWHGPFEVVERVYPGLARYANADIGLPEYAYILKAMNNALMQKRVRLAF